MPDSMPTAYATPVSAPIPEASPIDRAVDYTADRLDRLEVVLNTLAERLIPVSADTTPGGPPTSDRAGIPTTSRIGDRVAAFGLKADRLADEVVAMTHRLEV